MCMSVKPHLGVLVEGMFNGTPRLMVMWSAYDQNECMSVKV